MKIRILLTGVLLFFAIASWGQEGKDNKTKSQLTGENPDSDKASKYGISFIVGLGGIKSFREFYQMPIVDPIDKFVQLEKAQSAGLNGSLGIVYSPYYVGTKKIGDVQHGPSIAVFFNPINIVSNTGKIQDNFNLENMGLGLGWKFLSDFSAFLTFEAFSIKQPRQWFIDRFSKDPKSQYIIETNNTKNIQSSIDINDNNIFQKKYVSGIGIKVCYSIGIIKGFSGSKE